MSKYVCSIVAFLAFFFLLNCNSNPYSHGKIMYENFCSNCHIEDGTGLKGNIPPLANSDFLKINKEQLACIIRFGISGKIVVNGKIYDSPMEGIPQLKEVEITNIINYINHEWGNNNGYTTIQEVVGQLGNCDK